MVLVPLTTSGAIYNKAWSLIRVPPNHDDRSFDKNVRCLLAEGTKKSKNPQNPMKNRNDAADRNGWRFSNSNAEAGKRIQRAVR